MKAKANAAPKRPIEIKRGNVTVKIYTGANRVGDKEYPQFTLIYYCGDQRIKRRFADLGEAKREAELVCTPYRVGGLFRLRSFGGPLVLKARSDFEKLSDFSFVLAAGPRSVGLPGQDTPRV